MNVADQALRVEVVKVSDLYDNGYTLRRPGKQEGARFPFATEAPTAELMNGLSPQVGLNLEMRSAGPKPQAPKKERSKYPYNHRCLASRAEFEAAMRDL